MVLWVIAKKIVVVGYPVFHRTVLPPSSGLKYVANRMWT
jgi:hypothetical protein